MIAAAALLVRLALPGPCESPPPACTCFFPITPAQNFERAHAVFRGVVQDAPPGPGPHPLVATVRVVERWKGEVGDTVRVQTDNSNCGYRFVAGTEHLFYADLWQGRLFVTICSRTAPVGRAAEDLAALPALAAAQPAPTAAPKPRER